MVSTSSTMGYLNSALPGPSMERWLPHGLGKLDHGLLEFGPIKADCGKVAPPHGLGKPDHGLFEFGPFFQFIMHNS